MGVDKKKEAVFRIMGEALKQQVVLSMLAMREYQKLKDRRESEVTGQYFQWGHEETSR